MTTRPRVLVAMLGLDQHETAALAVATALRDGGFEVIYLGRFQTSQTIEAAAIAEDVDVIGISCHSWDYRAQLPDLLRRAQQLGVPVVLGGSVLTARDAEALLAAGVARVYGAGSRPQTFVEELRALALQRPHEASS